MPAAAGMRIAHARVERYDMPNTRIEDDVHVSGDLRLAWFEDPDGDVHALVRG